MSLCPRYYQWLHAYVSNLTKNSSSLTIHANKIHLHIHVMASTCYLLSRAAHHHHYKSFVPIKPALSINACLPSGSSFTALY